MLAYHEYRPHPYLQPWVRCIWELSRSRAPQEPLTLERILPDGCMEWVFHLGTPFRLLSASGRLERQAHALLAGVTTRGLFLEPSRDADVIGVRFRPGAAGAFLTPPPSRFIDRVAPLEEAEDRRLQELHDRLRDARPADRRRVLERDLLTRAVTIRPKANSLVFAVESLLTGRAAMDRIAADASLGPRQLQRRCAAEAGLSPRRLARIGRLQRAVRLLGTARPLVQVALDAGYADQAHFGREFLVFAGTTPASFRREAHAITAAFAAGD